MEYIHPAKRTPGGVHGRDILMVKPIHGGVYSRWSVHTVETYTRRGHVHGGIYTRKRYTHGGNIHGETYIGWNVHMVEHTHGGVYTR